MKRTLYSEEQIIGILTENEAGAKCIDLCRKYRMSEGTFYSWKSKYGCMIVSDAKRLNLHKDPLVFIQITEEENSYLLSKTNGSLRLSEQLRYWP